jgi:hypothetical protein
MKSAKRPFIRSAVLAAAVAAGIAALGSSGGAQPPFSNARLHGGYAGGYQGYLLLGGTILNHNGVEQITFDGNGGFSGSETFNILSPLGQLTCQGSLTGTYQINPDGTGTMALTFAPAANQDPNCVAAASTASIVLSTEGHAIDLVSTGNLAPEVAIHIHVRLQKQ